MERGEGVMDVSEGREWMLQEGDRGEGELFGREVEGNIPCLRVCIHLF